MSNSNTELEKLGYEIFDEAPESISIFEDDFRTYQYITTVEDLNRAVEDIKGYKFVYPDAPIAVDCETYRLDGVDEVPRPIRVKDGYQGYIRLLQIGLDPRLKDTQYLFDIKVLGTDTVSKLLKPILEESTVIGQNLKYEYQFLLVHMGIELKIMRDTMLINQVLMAGDPVQHGLDDLYAIYLNYGWFKDFTKMEFKDYRIFKKRLQKSTWGSEVLSQEQLRYASDDVRLIHHLYEEEMRALDQWRKDFERGFKPGKTILNVIKLECQLIPAFAMMELRGIHIDKDYHQNEAMKMLQEKSQEAILKVGEHFRHDIKFRSRWCPFMDSKDKPITDKRECVVPTKTTTIWYESHPINPNSTDQIHKYLGPHVSSLPNTEEDTLKLLINEHPSVRWILQYKKAQGLLSKFGQKLLNMSIDGVVYPHWHQIGSDEGGIVTGRSSCSEPNMMQILGRGMLFHYVFWNPELNQEILIQQGIPGKKLYRRSFVPPEGYIFIDYDYSQIEPRLTAEITEDPELLSEFSKDETDIYAVVHRAVHNLNYTPKSKKEYDRDAAKITFLGMSYGMGPKKLTTKMLKDSNGRIDWTDVSRWGVNYAQVVIERYYKTFYGIKAAQEEVQRKARMLPDAHGSLSPFKHRVPFAVEFTELGRPRRACLTPEQEKMSDEMLNRGYVKRDDHGKRMWNSFETRINEAARQLYNFKIQGSCADILKIAVFLIHNRFVEAGFDYFSEGIIGVIHDEILIRVKEEHKALAQEIVEKSMIQAAKPFLRRVKCMVEGASGKSWADAKGEERLIAA